MTDLPQKLVDEINIKIKELGDKVNKLAKEGKWDEMNEWGECLALLSLVVGMHCKHEWFNTANRKEGQNKKCMKCGTERIIARMVD